MTPGGGAALGVRRMRSPASAVSFEASWISRSRAAPQLPAPPRRGRVQPTGPLRRADSSATVPEASGLAPPVPRARGPIARRAPGLEVDARMLAHRINGE